jgi:hypothetical protein
MMLASIIVRHLEAGRGEQPLKKIDLNGGQRAGVFFYFSSFGGFLFCSQGIKEKEHYQE